jgi:uncharacterized protein
MKILFRLLLFYCVFSGASMSHAAQEPGAVEMRVKTLLIDQESQMPVIVLEAVSDKRTLPIWINVTEAKAIALELEHVTLPRPITHDLIRNILKALGATLQRMTITELRHNTYFALLTVVAKGQRMEIDSRPSDAIAIALRMKAPIFASPQVLALAKQLTTESSGMGQTQSKLGIQTQNLTPELAKLLDSQKQKGVLVAEVKLGGAGMKAGLQRGDVITKANEQPVSSINDLESLLQSAKSRSQLKLEVIKKGKPTTIVIDLPSS